MKRHLLIVTALAAPLSAFADAPEAPEAPAAEAVTEVERAQAAVFFEAGALLGLYAANVEYQLPWQFLVRGSGSILAIGEDADVGFLALTAGKFFFEGDHHAEASASVGQTFSPGEDGLIYTLFVGYRYQAPTGGLLLRSGLQALIDPKNESLTARILPVLSVGYAF